MKEKLVILGAGESGIGAALLGNKQAYDVFVSDRNRIADGFKNELEQKGISWEENGHSPERILEADLVIKSPGIPNNIEIVEAIRENSIPVIDEIELASWFTDECIIAVTGTNGKTTVVHWIYDMLQRAGEKAHLSGNVGNSFARQVAQSNSGIYVLEISSFQLEGIRKFKPDIAVLTNISPDHLDRYNNDYQTYIDTKFRIGMNQTEEDYFIFDADNEKIIKEVKKRTSRSQLLPMSFQPIDRDGASVVGNELKIHINKSTFKMDIREIGLSGKHNTKNGMAASTAAQLLRIRKNTIRESLSEFEGVEHRLEEVLKIDSVLYINDSKGTNVNSVLFALERVQPETVWIVGGEDKGNDYSELLPLVNEKVKAIICIGVDNSPLKKAFGNCVEYLAEAESMPEAVGLASQISVPGDTVLLSPACASYDRFENFEDRGRQFKNSVKNL